MLIQGETMKTFFAGCRCSVIAVVALISLTAAAPAAADWTSPQEISDAGTRNVSNLQVDANPAGDAVAAWNYQLPGVAAVISPAGSGPLSPQAYDGSYGPPTVGIGGNGVGALAFHLAADNAIYAASKPGSSNLFGASANIYGPGTETATRNPILAVNHLGTAQLFHDIGNKSSCCVHPLLGRLLDDPATNAWTAGSEFSASASETHNRAVATATDGSTVLLFKTNNGLGGRAVYPAVIDDDGTTAKGGAIDASSGNDPGDLTNPSGIALARTPDAAVVAALIRKEGTGGGVFILDFSKARAAGTGGGDPTEERVSGDEDGSEPNVETDTAGNVLVSWHDPSDGGADPDAIRARFRPAGSATWGLTETIATGDDLGGHDLAVDALGNAFLVYVDEEADAVVARIRKPGSAGIWGPAETVSTGHSGVDNPHIAAGGDYEAFMAYTADNGKGAPGRAVYSATGDASPKACEDGVDNDGDGLVDHPSDPGCSSPADDDESNPPAGGGDGGGSSGGSGPAGGGSSPGGKTGDSGEPKASTACTKASKRFATTNKQLKKAKKKVKKAKKAKGKKGKRQLKKAKGQFKKLKKKSKKAKGAKRRACAKG